jgi:HSP20 family protein
MAFRFYTTHPLYDVFESLVDGVDNARLNNARCEGGPCGPNYRYRHHHRRHRGDTSDVHVPKADIYSTETDYKVYVDLPSVEKETIELTYDPEQKVLAVAGTFVRPADFAGLDEEALKKALIQSERRAGKFEGKWKIPRDDDGERIKFAEASAKYENGVLELTLPKAEKEAPKPIVIE